MVRWMLMQSVSRMPDLLRGRGELAGLLSRGTASVISASHRREAHPAFAKTQESNAKSQGQWVPIRS